MRRVDIRKLAADPRFISGIYNYCDRWCERCSFTARCLVYATEQLEDDGDPAARDVRNAAFWRRLQGIFEQTRQMIEEIAAEHGIDLSERQPEVEQALERHKQRRAAAKTTPLARAAQSYLKQAEAWFEAHKGLFAEKGKELVAKAKWGLAGVEQECCQLKDLVEVIRWYQPFIYTKLTRACSSSLRQPAEPAPGLPTDADGSAKIALIAIDRSLNAWAELRNFFPEQTDSLLELLVGLDRLRRQVEAAFPNARKFVRPGFDTEAA